MLSEKKLAMEDTWKTGDLEKHMRRGVYDEDNMRRKDRRRRDEEGKKDRSGDSERQDRAHEREAPRERDRHKERDSTRERTKPRDPDRDKDQDRRREERRDERERERRREREHVGERDRAREGSRPRDREHESRERRHERVEKDSRDRERERKRAEWDQERGTERERKREQGRDGDRERDRERTRERERDRDKDRDREKDYEKKREKERHRDRERGHSSKHVKEINDYRDELQGKYLEQKRENERRERHGEREHSRQKEDKEYQEQRHKEKDEGERRHREREERQSRERQRHEDKLRDEERARRHGERREEAHRRLSSDTGNRHARSHDRPENRRPTEERDRENGLAKVTPEARLHSGSEKGDREPKETKVEKEEGEVEKAEGQEDGDGAEYYEEDFEDYEDDFEEADESEGEGEDDDGEKTEEGNKEELSPQKRREIEEIRRAMNAENERVGSSQPHTRDESQMSKSRSDVPQSKRTQHGRFIDFVAAKHREVGKKIASKQKKRSIELLRLIDLDFSVTFPLLDLPPVNEYDMYIKSFGTTNTKQAYVQCNEDNTDRDIQTEEIEADDKWTQHPGDSRTVCGGPKLTIEASDESMAKMNIDSKRLAEFLLSASQVVAVLLEEDRAERHSLRKLKSQAHSLTCSDGCLTLNTNLPFLHGREVSLIGFSHVQRQTLLSVHSPASRPGAVRLDSKTVLCVWNIWEPSSPRQVLVYESEVLCCCFSPGKASLVLAGTAVGSVVVWDLREHSSLHQTVTIGDRDWTLRCPTFSTDAVLSPLGHSTSVRSVEPVPVAVVTEGVRPELSLLSSRQESSGLSFQLASLDESGVMNMWVVVELQKADQAGSQTDLGLKPGGKVKLLHSSTLTTNESRSSQRDAVKTGPLHTLLLKFFPSDSNHFFIGTDMGVVTHGTRHGGKIPPKFYRPLEDGLRPVCITALDVSPFGEPLFLVGCADGSVRLHSVSSEQPVMEWSSSTGGEPVVSVQWALTRPAVFCVLDAASNLHLWDLLEKDYEPLTTQKLHSGRVTTMAVFGDPDKPSTLSGVCLAKESGEIEIQYFSKKWAVPAHAELDTIHNILNEAF
ncbi:cytoplasmic dynein 2 intermediate chain 1 isoform X1 [Conger conger]|uniref:cytoplasmic dynein 2 intermediate chain 1 isoform X1 n=1 Tax=Conger conger TaxID=82655 RepID=UPI002A5A1D5F|nr:cytoplasmic dynein 2 intermediate chain 1 isoform X1 [Conger conger]